MGTERRVLNRRGRWVRPSILGLALVAMLSAACSSAGTAAVEVESTGVLAIEGASAASDTDIDLDGAPFLHRPVDREAPGFSLTDQDGNIVNLSDFAGKWVLIDWVFTNCVTFCPLLTGGLNVVHSGLGDAVGQDVQLVSITFDPTRDTPEALRAYASAVAPDQTGWAWLTGTEAETGAVAAAYGVSFDPAPSVNGVAQFDHTSLLVIVDPNGREKHRYFGSGWSQDVIERLEAAFGSAPAPSVPAADREQPLSAAAADLLETAIALPWEDWELEAGVSSQILYQFPSTGQLASFVRQSREDTEDGGAEVSRVNLSAMTVAMMPGDGGAFTGIGYTENLAVVVEGDSRSSVLGALSVLDNEWCCGTPG